MKFASLLTTLITLALVLTAAFAETVNSAPRLILQITVDQLRGDLPGRYADRYGEGGFRYLLEKGTHYSNAHYQHSNLETIVGHVVLATGAFPSAHGMVANVWMNRATGEVGYAIEDAAYDMVGLKGGVDKKSELDPTQAAAKSGGRSPRAILTSTFSDELAVATAGRAKIFGVSVKDRGAISLAGHAGKAFWFSKKTGEFVSSTYYYEQYPDWVKEWNEKRLADSYEGKSWELLQDRSKYVYRDTDDRPYETALPGYGRVFPHPFGKRDNKLFYTLLTLNPVGDKHTLDFAKSLIENEQLGQDDVPDYLVQEPYWFLYSDESVPLCTIHGSPWRYDTYVPIIFAGGGVPAQQINRLVHPVDIASTLSACVGSKPPSAAAGEPLLEVLNR